MAPERVLPSGGGVLYIAGAALRGTHQAPYGLQKEAGDQEREAQLRSLRPQPDGFGTFGTWLPTAGNVAGRSGYVRPSV